MTAPWPYQADMQYWSGWGSYFSGGQRSHQRELRLSAAAITRSQACATWPAVTPHWTGQVRDMMENIDEGRKGSVLHLKRSVPHVSGVCICAWPIMHKQKNVKSAYAHSEQLVPSLSYPIGLFTYSSVECWIMTCEASNHSKAKVSQKKHNNGFHHPRDYYYPNHPHQWGCISKMQSNV